MSKPINSLANLTEKEVETVEIALSLYAQDICNKGARVFKEGKLEEVGFYAGALSTIQDLIKRLPIKI